MSFFTFNSEPHRRFVLWLLALVVLPVAVLFVIGIYLQPLYGDLTRIGFYSEREFGWSGTQVIFPNTKLEFNALPNNNSQLYKILVLGDSFSRVHPELQWQNYLKEISHESIGTMDINKIRLHQILASQGFRDNPPKVLIMESVERELPHHLKENMSTCQITPSDTRKIDSSPDITPIIDWNWESHIADITQHKSREINPSEINPSYVLKFLWNNIPGDLIHPNVYRIDITRPALFSSRDQSAFLVYQDDVNKIKLWRKMGLPEMSCRIEEIRRQVEANGYTRFILMVPPDKLTAYSDYLSDSKFQHASLLSALSELHPKVMPRLDKALITAIHAGEQDVYFPDDTHWASNGQRIAAETLISFMKHPKE